MCACVCARKCVRLGKCEWIFLGWGQGEFDQGLRHGAGSYTVFPPKAPQHTSPAADPAAMAAAYEGEWVRACLLGVAARSLPLLIAPIIPDCP